MYDQNLDKNIEKCYENQFKGAYLNRKNVNFLSLISNLIFRYSRY